MIRWQSGCSNNILIHLTVLYMMKAKKKAQHHLRTRIHANLSLTRFFYYFRQWASLLMHCCPTWRVARRYWKKQPCVSARAVTRTVCCPSPCLESVLLVCAPVLAAPPPRSCSRFSVCHRSDPMLARHAARRYTNSAERKQTRSPLSAGKTFFAFNCFALKPRTLVDFRLIVKARIRTTTK